MSEQKENYQVTTTNGGINSLATAQQFFSPTGANRVWTSLPLTDRVKISQAMGDATHNLRDYFKSNLGAEPIEFVHALVHDVEIVTDNGEVVNSPRIVLIAADGKTYSSVAKGALSSLGNLFAIFGLPPYDPPLKIIAREVKTRRGFYTLNLVPVED